MLLSIVPTARLVTPGYFTNSDLIEIIVSVHLFLEVKKKKIIGCGKIPRLQIESLISETNCVLGLFLEDRFRLYCFGFF